MQILINEGLAMYNPQGRLVRTDGLDLPRNTIGAGGVAKFLRDERDRLNDPGPSRKGKGRETPPHFAQPAGLQYGGCDILGRDVYAISSSPWPASYPVTRSQKEHNYEPYPAKKPERKQKQAPTLPPPPKRSTESQILSTSATLPPPQPQPPVTRVTKTAPRAQAKPAPVVQAQAPLLQPLHQNTADGWKEKKKVKKNDTQDVDMQDALKNKGGYHFTSTIQDMADGDVIQSKILDTIITLLL